MYNQKKSITVVIPITAQNATLQIPNYTTLSKLNICEAVIFTAGKAKTGKERAEAAILQDCFFKFTGFNNAILHEISGEYFTPNSQKKANEFILNKADIQDATITINTAETITDKVIEITFFYNAE
jgi:hypothetical protein